MPLRTTAPDSVVSVSALDVADATSESVSPVGVPVSPPDTTHAAINVRVAVPAKVALTVAVAGLATTRARNAMCTQVLGATPVGPTTAISESVSPSCVQAVTNGAGATKKVMIATAKMSPALTEMPERLGEEVEVCAFWPRYVGVAIYATKSKPLKAS